ncbi:MAG: hypothetical protein M5U24_01845 [Candidatus Kuenenia sp.]|uniref:hypothetical protein n=1 Tax=Candidatus Kuenenia sp. TaxID=2499824 RepID=UPI0022BF4471|nr:hypothetical protein [Candidatus Kuenenia sp.]MCZ7621215.1 hypothetical protein [Candidatus Kuenenia sp.]
MAYGSWFMAHGSSHSGFALLMAHGSGSGHVMLSLISWFMAHGSWLMAHSSWQQSAISNQLSAISYQQSAISYNLVDRFFKLL